MSITYRVMASCNEGFFNRFVESWIFCNLCKDGAAVANKYVRQEYSCISLTGCSLLFYNLEAATAVLNKCDKTFSVHHMRSIHTCSSYCCIIKRDICLQYSFLL